MSDPGSEKPPREVRRAARDPARRLKHYVLVKQVGKGGAGVVWKAWDKRLARWVAMKILRRDDPEQRARFLREAQLAVRLSHVNLVTVYEAGETEAGWTGGPVRPYLVEGFVEGLPLADSLLPLPETCRVMAAVARAMDHAHRAGVIHRDLKPQNIMIAPDGSPCVTDFGLARPVEGAATLSSTGAILGTPPYMPPEQARGELEAVDARSDVYALGATLYASVCGKPPYAGENAAQVVFKVLLEKPAAPRLVNPGIPEGLERIILRAMEREKERRYPSAAALAEDLERWLVQQGQPASEATVVKKTRRAFARRRKTRAGLIVAVAVLLAITAFLLLRR